jgi:hypothetical protein
MIAGMDEIVNPSLNVSHPDLAPIEVDVKNLKRWGDE